MSVTYETANREALACLGTAREEWHDDRLEGVRVGLIFAYAPEDEETGDPTGPALKRHGVPCLALARIVSAKDRVAGLPDALIYVDGAAWKGLTEREKLALLDHELTHIGFPENRGEDCGGRPKLKMRDHDYEFGFFTEVAERHGRASQEVQQATRFVDIAGQVYLLGFEIHDSAAEKVTPIRPPAATSKMKPLPKPEENARPAGLQPADELISAVGKAKVSDLTKRIKAGGWRLHTLAALRWAETCQTKPRVKVLGLVDDDGLDQFVETADIWAALLLVCRLPAKLEHIEAGLPVVLDVAVVRHVQAVELRRGKKAREDVVQLCEDRLAELLGDDSASEVDRG